MQNVRWMSKGYTMSFDHLENTLRAGTCTGGGSR
jgi:hypothetical protein